MQATAARIRAAFDARDMDLLRSLVATDASWGDDPDSDRFCHDRDEIMADYERLRDAGVVGTVIETIAGPNGVACLLEVQWTDSDRRGRGPRLYQAFRVENDLITRITGHDTEAEARAAISS